MIAMLGMYDHPAIQAANDRYWTAIRDHLGYGPATLTRDMDFFDMWLSPDLLLGQTCGLPYRARLYDKVQKIGTPNYGIEGAPDGHYRSCFVVRRDHGDVTLADFDGKHLAFNESVSQSGWAGPLTHMKRNGVTPGKMTETGAHLHSVQAVAAGAADIAGIDAITWNILLEHEPVTEKLQVIDMTPPTPGHAYITAPGNDVEALEAAIRAAIDQLSAADRAALQLKGMVQIPVETYLDVETPPPPAAAA
ncbi:phosphate/phosphite/phosphonate ABC transporter substrate-binding protein [Chachezhania sediminis]|uniref:phosphate/phosphite/phosphonate ABC transporter substrate-binding protein n=1 Tax=Chachezhania sediminis TaxID=2599291 RepID=UPI00131CAAF1|nr:PhnD/SsuA/transferrin family substrate-binding protein [Chachezhania sediminis]